MTLQKRALPISSISKETCSPSSQRCCVFWECSPPRPLRPVTPPTSPRLSRPIPKAADGSRQGHPVFTGMRRCVVSRCRRLDPLRACEWWSGLRLTRYFRSNRKACVGSEAVTASLPASSVLAPSPAVSSTPFRVIEPWATCSHAPRPALRSCVTVWPG